MASVVFGMVSYQGQISALHLQSVTEGQTASTAEAIDEDGDIEQIDVYAKKKTISVTGNMLGSAFPYKVGGKLEVGQGSYIITSVSIVASVTGHQQCTITGEDKMDKMEKE